MSFLDLEQGKGYKDEPTNIQDEENQILYNIILKLTTTINQMNKFLQVSYTDSKEEMHKIDMSIVDCDQSLEIYNNNPVSKNNNTKVRYKLEHDLNEIVNSYEPIKKNYYQKKISLTKNKDKSYGSIEVNDPTSDKTAEEPSYQSFFDDSNNNNIEQSELLLQEEIESYRQKQLQVNNQENELDQRDLDIHNLRVQNHSESVSKIQKQVTEVNQIFHNLNDLILKQNTKVLTIEDNIQSFHDDAINSDLQLKNANRALQKRGRCWLIFLVSASLFILLLLIIAL
ncbi:SNAP receptor [Hanseniaspora uvarum]|nr:SNAP receptor [Hanseniaspora uvarum]